MNVNIKSIIQEIAIDDGQVVHSLLVELPNGNQIKLAVAEEDVDLLLSATVQFEDTPLEELSGSHEESDEEDEDDYIDEVSHLSVTDNVTSIRPMVDWTELSEEDLPSFIKEQLSVQNIPNIVSKDRLNELILAIVNGVLANSGNVEPPAPPGRVRPRSTSMRTVPKDEFGYPIVQGNGSVPASEVTGGRDQDEDGVGQA